MPAARDDPGGWPIGTGRRASVPLRGDARRLDDGAETRVTQVSQAVLQRIRANYLVKKLGLADGPGLDAGIDKTVETYGRGNRSKHRAVFYYLLARHFGHEAAYA